MNDQLEADADEEDDGNDDDDDEIGIPRIESLEEYQVPMNDSVVNYLQEQYMVHYHHDSDDRAAQEHVTRFRSRMKQSPRQTVLRLTHHSQNRTNLVSQIQTILEQWILPQQDNNITPPPPPSSSSSSQNSRIRPLVQAHSILPDVITIDLLHVVDENNKDEIENPSLYYHSRVPPPDHYPTIFLSPDDDTLTKRRIRQGWPLTHRVVLVDRMCGEAVLRGAPIFVKGILGADAAISPNETVAVYVNVSEPPPRRGFSLAQYTGQAIFLGLGISDCPRSEYFSKSTGIGITMSLRNRAGPPLPPLSLLEGLQLYAQNMPSICVGRALDPQSGDIIYDMCGAPGGKTSHLVLLAQEGRRKRPRRPDTTTTIVVMSDKRRSKVRAAQQTFQSLFDESYARQIVPLHLDATTSVDRTLNSTLTVPQILAQAKRSELDGLLEVTGFTPESFDKILLDPPCSAMGLRPKLQSQQQQSAKELMSHAKNQRRFFPAAVALLKPGGILTYSTCTIHAAENETNVRFLLDQYSCMELVPITWSSTTTTTSTTTTSTTTMIPLGSPGLMGYGLNDAERNCVRRFDSFVTDNNNNNTNDDDHNNSLSDQDVMGFFLAKFRKKIEATE